MLIETHRLEIIVLIAAQLHLLANDIAALEADLECTYKGEPLMGRFLDAIRLQANKSAEDELNLAFHSFWLMIRKQDRTAIGMAGFKGPPGDEREVEIGYGIGEQHRGNGFMAEAVRAICAWALEQRTVDRVIAETETNNTPSERVLELCGFVKYKTMAESAWWELCTAAR